MRYAPPFIAALLTAMPALASPLEISAAGGLEWNRTNKTYTATKDVIATRDTARVTCDTLTAHYTGENNASDITKLVAKGRVVLSSPPYKAYGDKAIYTVATGDAVLTGKNLRIAANAEHLTARDKIIYNAQNATMTAIGNATAHKDGRTLTSESLTAWFEKGANNKMTTKKVTTSGPVTITTENEVITGDSGFYDVATQTATLTGNVRITQGESFLEGTRATVDMKTGISRLSAQDSTATDGRVKGVFYPKKKQ
ncbi:MAG: hypothetical protein OXT65_06440 [Alphaproteobacteria bacterium]|nr:hypothetical protein [Alphaproteobacteria bacterium]